MWGVVPNVESFFQQLGTSPRNDDVLLPSHFRPPKKIIVMGAPASGKGTQCQALAKKHGLVHLSTGDMLRRAVSSGSVDSDTAPYISTIKKCMETGQLIPDDIIVRLVLDRLQSSDCQNRGWILDGFPRTARQARALQDAGISPYAFLFLNVPDEVAINRVVGRRTDPLTGRVYHVDWNPPPNDEDVRQRLIIRSDDTAESMKQRLKQFRKNAQSVKACYRNIIEIDGQGQPQDVCDEINSSLNALGRRMQRA